MISSPVINKQKYLQLITSNKNDNLNIIDSFPFRFGGRMLKVFWKTQFTKFDITEYVKVSKKQRTNISEKKTKEVLQYCFLGYCFNFKKDQNSINKSFSLRNVLDGLPIEMIFPLFSPNILNVIMIDNLKSKKISRNKFFFLRKKPVPESFIDFSYVSRKKTLIAKQYVKTIKKLKK